MDPQSILRAIGGALTNVAPLASGPWGVALTGIGAAVSLVADLVSHGLDAPVTIEEIRSVLPDYLAAKERLRKLLDEKTRRP